MAIRESDSADLLHQMITVLHHVHHSTLLTNLRHHHPSPYVRHYIDNLLCHVRDLLVYLCQQQLLPTASHHLLQEMFVHIRHIIRPLRRFVIQFRQAHQGHNNQFLLQVRRAHLRQVHQRRSINIIHLVTANLHGDVLVVRHHLFVSHQFQDPQN
ncbi:hypothetical protein SLEP1_g43285 [Rubroshorea leprosula]|uniref:Uncharacterized protein n=1 Tax=Rubroshorea leprosula TaxID=152421 RepID=A0AAV5LD88_9ROSI|nr:hypothetical protein SLEP1_g43285 [Rubroshorea leprosula]